MENMTPKSKTKQALLAENAELRAQLGEAQETLQAIRDGEVDAIIVGEQVYMLERAGTSSNLFRGEVLAQINDAVIAMDNGLRVTYLNPAAERQYGVTATEALGNSLNELYENCWLRPEDETVAFAEIESTGSWRGETIHITRNGQELHVESVVNRLRDVNGTPIGLLAVIRNIGERRRAEATQAQLVAFVESSTDAIYSHDFAQRILSWNKSAEKLFGYTASEVIGKSIKIIIPSNHQAEEWEILERLKHGKCIDHYEAVRLRKNGTRVDVSISVSPLRDMNGRIIGASKIGRDISERKRLEEALRTSEAKFHNLLDTLPAAAYTCDAEGLITYYNQRAVELWGREPKLNDPENRFCGSFKLFSTDGIPLTHDQCWMALTLKEDKEYNGYEVVVERSDGSRQSGLVHINPIHDESGKLLGAVNVIVDITDRKRAEKEKEELLIREKAARAEAQTANRSKDEFLSLVSHELRSPLNSILGYNRILRSNPHDAKQITQSCDVIQRNVQRQIQIIEDLLDITRIVSGKLRLDKQPTDIVPVLDEALAVVRPGAEARGIELLAHYNTNPEMVIGDSIRLQQVIGNLLSNALKFTPEGGRIDLKLERADNNLSIVVSDTGQGIAPAFLPHIFDRFRQADMSSSRRHGGLGLGLALVKHLVGLHGGTVEATSKGIDLGSTFTVRLPLAAKDEIFDLEQPAIITEGINPVPETAIIEGLRVLVVDDQQEARALIVNCLTKYGAEVTAVSSGIEIMSILTDTRDTDWPDVLICDIVMPVEDGYAVMMRVRALEKERRVKLRHRIAAIALTSMVGRESWVQALRAGFNTHVTKPAEPQELVKLIYNLTAERGKIL
jgi:PAS domain S-box-containing protein